MIKMDAARRGWAIGITLLLCGVLMFTACPNDSEGEDPPGEDPILSADELPGQSGGRALFRRPGGYEDVDGLSSASILRVSRDTFGYIDKKEGGYHIKLVDVGDPTVTVREKLVAGSGDNVALWTTGDQGKIILVSAYESGYETFSGFEVLVYDQDLKVLGRFPFGKDDVDDAEPLHHRDPALAVTDKYAIAGWDSDDAGGTYISIYALSGSKTGHIATSSLSLTGDITAFAAHGDYMIVGTGAATKVFKINAGGANITLDHVDGLDQTDAGPHWMLDNQSYVLEPLSGKGTVRVWQWNGASPPSMKGIANVEASSGSVQAISFDNDDSARAYIYGKVAANMGNVYSINLTNAAVAKLFNIGGYYHPPVSGRNGYLGGMTGPLSGIWTIQVEKSGPDTYYILGGAIAAVGTSGDANYKAATNGVLVIKNPAANATINPSGAIANDTALVDALADFPTAVRTMKTFKSGGEIYYAAKNYSANPITGSTYMLRLMKVGD